MSLLARNLDRQKFDCHVVVLTHSGPIENELRDAGVQVHLVGKRGKLDPSAVLRLTNKLRELSPAIVHTWLFAANSYGRIAAKRAGVPVIVAGERCVDPWKRWWHHAIDRRLAGMTDRIVTNSQGIVEFYVRHGIGREKFTVIPNAVVSSDDAHKTNVKLSKAEFFQRLGLEPRGRVVGAVGRLWKQKGYKDLIWAGELLRVAHQDVWIVIVGDGPERGALQHFRDQIHAERAIKFVGHREDAAELMSAFDILWNGSLYEGQSNTILEAMSLGIPVIASDIPGNRDLVVHGQTGYLYPLADVQSLIRQSNALLRDDETMRRMGDGARERVRSEFSLQKMVEAHSELYQSLLSAKPTATRA